MSPAGHEPAGTRPLGPREILGVPALPPGAMTAVAERLRAAVAGLHRRLAPPPLQVLEGVLGLLDPVALGALCRLDVPDQLDRPVPLARLAAAVDAEDDVVERLVRYAAGRGWLRLDRRGRVHATRTTRFLRRDLARRRVAVAVPPRRPPVPGGVAGRRPPRLPGRVQRPVATGDGAELRSELLYWCFTTPG